MTSIEFNTRRLILREIRFGDTAQIGSWRSLPDVARFQSWTTFEEADGQRLLEGQAGLAVDTPGTWFQLVIVDRASALLVGDLALHFPAESHRQVEIGINLAPGRQGQGYAAEAIRCVLDYLFNQLGKHRVVAITDAENDAAARLFRRLGFRQEGHFIEHVWFKGQWGSEYLFAMLASEWCQGGLGGVTTTCSGLPSPLV